MIADARLIPENTRETIDAWVREARPVGSFVEAVLSNDLTGAISRADAENLVALPHIVAYLYNECPGWCWGSRERFREWPQKLEELRNRSRRIEARHGET